jgi:hypothetical protein
MNFQPKEKERKKENGVYERHSYRTYRVSIRSRQAG